MNKTICLLVILILTTSFTYLEDVYIWFPSDIGVNQNCEGDEIIVEFEFITNSRKKIEIYGFNFNNNDYTLEVNGKEKSITEILKIRRKHPLKVKIKFKRDYNKNQKTFKFKTNQKGFLENAVKIKYGQYNITSKSIRDRKEQIVNISESCSDSLTIRFPYGGTVSYATIYKDSIHLDKPYKYISYMMRNKKNHMQFSKADIGKYYVRFGSCHWGNYFWLTIK